MPPRPWEAAKGAARLRRETAGPSRGQGEGRGGRAARPAWAVGRGPLGPARPRSARLTSMIFSFFFWSAFLLPPAGCCCFLGGMAGRAERPQLSLGGSQGRGEGGAERDGRGGDGTAAPPPPGRRNGSRPRGTLGTQRQARRAFEAGQRARAQLPPGRHRAAERRPGAPPTSRGAGPTLAGGAPPRGGRPLPAVGGRSPRWAGLRGVRLPAEPGAAAEAAVGSKGGARTAPPPSPPSAGVVPRRPGKRLGEGGWRSPGALPGRIRARRWESRLSAGTAWFTSGKGGRFPLRSGGWGKGELPATPLGGSDLPASRRPALKGPNPAQHRQPFWAACSCLCQLQGFKEAVRKAAGLLAA